MHGATIDRLLAWLVVALAVTGIATLRSGDPGSWWLFVAHGLLAGALGVAIVVKLRSSLPRAVRARRWGRLVLGLVVTVAASAVLVAGFAWVLSGRLLTLGSWTILTIHAWIGLVLVPITVVHLLPWRWRLLLPRGTGPAGRGREARLTRRGVLAGGAFGALAVALFGLAQAGDRLAGGVRRFTGSRWLPTDGVPPPTTFYGEGAPDIDPAAWRLTIRATERAMVEPRVLTFAEMRALGEVDLRAVLDCTSGWAMETTWRGVPLRSVMTAAGATPGGQVVVRSATGWGTVLSPADAEGALLATAVAGAPLPAASGAPCRLVVPNRRGLDWVKWVVEIECRERWRV